VDHHSHRPTLENHFSHRRLARQENASATENASAPILGARWQQNAHSWWCKAFNGKLRDELLDREIFYTLQEARILVEGWRQRYNTVRRHSALSYRPPAPATRVFPIAASPSISVLALGVGLH
jgi:hypothetical protein